MENAPILGAFSSVVSYWASYSLTRKHGGDCALFLCRELNRGKGRTVTGRSKKLAQEGLRGDRNRLAVGKRVGSGVREVAHDLKGVRGAGRLLHRRERMGYDGVSRLRLGKKPGRTVLRDQKIHFGLRLVPYVVERVVAEAEDFYCERYIKIGHRHQYQTDRWVRMVSLFKTRQRTAPSFFAVN